jgi:hypothetical protein
MGLLVGTAGGVVINFVTGGLAGNLIQSMPVVGGLFFGGHDWDAKDPNEVAMQFYTQAAMSQGYMASEHQATGTNPDIASKAAGIFESLLELQDINAIPPTADAMMMAGRMAGFEGFPWEPETVEPIYSAEEINSITSNINQYLQPQEMVIDTLGGMNFDHIIDPDVRANLEAWQSSSINRLQQGLSAAAAAPAVAAITSEVGRQSQASLAQQSQLGYSEDEYEQFAELLQ